MKTIKEKKGFTLTELLVVIVIIAVVAAIAVPSIILINKNINKRLYDNKVEMIEAAAKVYATDNPDIFGEQLTVKIYVGELINNDYLDPEYDSSNASVDDCNIYETNSSTSNATVGCIINPVDKSKTLNSEYVLITKKQIGFNSEFNGEAVTVVDGDKVTVKYYQNYSLTDNEFKYYVEIYGNSITLANNDLFSRGNYTLSGWCTDSSCSGTYYAPNALLTLGNELIADVNEVKLYAKWIPVTYAINYDLDGGSASNPTSYSCEDQITLNNPTRKDYIFNGWTGSNGTIASNNVVIPKGSFGEKSYKANWIAEPSYTITLNNSNATTSGTTSILVKKNSSNLTAITNPQNVRTISYNDNGTGASLGATSKSIVHTFTGWYTSTSGGVKIINENGKLIANVSGYTNSSGEWIKESNITLYSQWKYNTAQLTTISKTSYVCSWNSNSGGTGTTYAVGSNYTPSANVILYARCVSYSTTFSYTGTIQTYVAPVTGAYKLETWGASGGKHYIMAGYGAYATGTVNLSQGEVLYVVVGGNGGHTGYYTTGGGTAGYNGGGKGGNGYAYSTYPDGSAYQGGGGGGGATHIATVSGVLSSLSSYRNSVLIVAGGGGGSSQWLNGKYCDATIGSGGGYKGNNGGGGTLGGTLTSGYSFGQGQNGRNSTSTATCAGEGGGGGGGGWYGGYAYQGTESYSCKNGAGGSSYTGNSRLYNAYTYCRDCATSSVSGQVTYTSSNADGSQVSNNPPYGDGKATITYIQ